MHLGADLTNTHTSPGSWVLISPLLPPWSTIFIECAAHRFWHISVWVVWGGSNQWYKRGLTYCCGAKKSIKTQEKCSTLVACMRLCLMVSNRTNSFKVSDYSLYGELLTYRTRHRKYLLLRSMWKTARLVMALIWNLILSLTRVMNRSTWFWPILTRCHFSRLHGRCFYQTCSLDHRLHEIAARFYLESAVPFILYLHFPTSWVYGSGYQD